MYVVAPVREIFEQLGDSGSLSPDKKKSLVEKAPWQPWYAEKGSQKAPAGYVTTYSVPGKTFPSKGPDASFLTIRLAGHMVPTFQPEAALAFISRYFRGEAF